jgi:hypothetical protein
VAKAVAKEVAEQEKRVAGLRVGRLGAQARCATATNSTHLTTSLIRVVEGNHHFRLLLVFLLF